MKFKNTIVAFLSICFVCLCFLSQAQSGINKANCFDAMASSNISVLDAQLSSLSNVSNTDKEAFEGALLMRKAGVLKIPAQKLASFKKGHKQLEAAIAKAPHNAEYRFLRLIVQENAPKVLGYYRDMVADSKFIKDNYKLLPKETQQAVLIYSKKSTSLNGLF